MPTTINRSSGSDPNRREDPQQNIPKRKFSGDSAKDKLVLFAGIGIVAVVIFVVINSRHGSKSVPRQSNSPVASKRNAPHLKKKQRSTTAGSLTPSNEANQHTGENSTQSDQNVTSNLVAGTAQPLTPNSSSSKETKAASAQESSGVRSPRSIGQVPKFPNPQPGSNGQWQPAPYGNGNSTSAPSGTSEETARAYEKEVTAPSMVFTASANSATPAKPSTSAQSLAINEATNFGLEPGYHVAARIESVASTALSAPVVAVVSFNYEKDGRIIIPAGARVVGQISGATSTGIMGIKFTSIYMPDGSTVPISAVATNRSLGPLKGFVTGRHRALKILLGALQGIGGAASLYGNVNNANSAITPTDQLRNNLSSNLGNAADSQIQQINVSRNIVVTVPAGTPVYVTFTAPVRSPAHRSGQNNPAQH